MKKILLSLTLIVSGIVRSGLSSATLIESYSGNDNVIDPDSGSFDQSVFDTFVENFYSATGLDSTTNDWDWNSFSFYDKVDAPNTSSTNLFLSDLTGKQDEPNEWISGSATTNDPVDFFSVKADNKFAMYWLDPAQQSFVWYTNDISGNAAMSHISTWTVDRSSAPVPEPGTMFLFGTGLLGLIGIGRRKFTSKA